MKRKEAIVRYLAMVGRANIHQTAIYTGMPPTVVPPRLTELKRSGLVTNMTWPDGSRVWTLTENGCKRHDYYQRRDKKREESGEEAGPSR